MDLAYESLSDGRKETLLGLKETLLGLKETLLGLKETLLGLKAWHSKAGPLS